MQISIIKELNILTLFRGIKILFSQCLREFMVIIKLSDLCRMTTESVIRRIMIVRTTLLHLKSMKKNQVVDGFLSSTHIHADYPLSYTLLRVNAKNIKIRKVNSIKKFNFQFPYSDSIYYKSLLVKRKKGYVYLRKYKR